jgi:choline dehydrogenase-like flavoprotein
VDAIALDRSAEASRTCLYAALIRLNRSRVRQEPGAVPQMMGGGHIMGTTRMGRTRSDSVVDRDCRVHGYDNFFVAGSSLFPSGGFVNPTLTIVALAVRLADEIARRG